MLQTISPDLLPFISTVINGSLMSGHVPTAFKKARVIPILKKPALDPSDISNYRPESWNLWNSMGMVCFLPGWSLISDTTASARISSWMTAHQLKLNPSKTELLIIPGLPLNAIHPLQMIQNAAAQLVFNLPKFSHTTPLLRSLHWLPVAARIRFKTLMLAYKAKNGPAPSYLKALITPRTAPRSLRSTSTARLVPPSLREIHKNRPGRWGWSPSEVRSSSSPTLQPYLTNLIAIAKGSVTEYVVLCAARSLIIFPEGCGDEALFFLFNLDYSYDRSCARRKTGNRTKDDSMDLNSILFLSAILMMEQKGNDSEKKWKEPLHQYSFIFSVSGEAMDQYVT
ncbi:hypothetical protein QTP86_011015 [Hemibagrus guttatus]|nr:hypothetical protein QTP86_011015 [Hemibagrus guttatus]